MENIEKYNNQEDSYLGEDQAPFIPEASGEKHNPLEFFRNISLPIRNVIIGLAIGLVAEKGFEYKQIKNQIEASNADGEILRTLEAKISRAQELFGENVDLRRYRALEAFMQEKRDIAESSLAHFSFFNYNVNELPERPTMNGDNTEETNGAMESDSIEFNETVASPYVDSHGMEYTQLKNEAHKISYKKFMEFLSNSVFPKGAIQGEIRCIVQKPDTRGTLNKSYYNNDASERNGVVIAQCTPYLSSENVITLFQPSVRMEMNELLETLAHEIGHANDWDSDNSLSAEDRFDLLLAVSNRVRSKDRFMSSYVESINNDDNKIELYNKCVEYWAEIYSAYILRPSMLNYEDFKIVDALVKKADPDFKARIFLDQQRGLFSEIRKISHEH